MFMFHENKSENGAHYAKGWRAKKIYNANDLAKLVNEFAVSPCIWSQGIRGKQYFKLAEWVGLDFDEGMTLDDAMRIFGGYHHVIGTTKSHGILKGGKVCDRFRVFIKLNDVCENVDDYEYTVKLLIKKYGADKTCSDGGRLFFYCRKIVQVNDEGDLLPIIDSTEMIKKQKARMEQRQKDYIKMFGLDTENKGMPADVNGLLEDGVAGDVCRNLTCYQIGADLGCLNYSVSEIVDLIINSAIPASKPEPLTIEEITRAVSNGVSKKR